MFYFNRFIAWVISNGLRQFLWRKYRISLRIQALQISLIGGRIFFKGVRYCGHNETVLVHSGNVTWKYWLRRVRVAEVLHQRLINNKSTASSSRNVSDHERAHNQEANESNRNKTLPCRVQVKTSGVEVFFYNRSPAYDFILDGLLRPEQESKTGSIRTEYKQYSSTIDGGETKNDSFIPSESPNELLKNCPPLPRWLSSLPISVGCKKGAIVIGNYNTRNIVIAKFISGKGFVDACPCGPLDIYKQLFSLTFTGITISLDNNPDFKELQHASAIALKGNINREGQKYNDASDHSKSTEESQSKALRTVLSLFRKPWKYSARAKTAAKQQVISSTDPKRSDQSRWQGLTRYQNAIDSDQDDWDVVDYAKIQNVAEFTSVKAIIYWDIPGIVPLNSGKSNEKGEPRTNNVNGATSPDYGVDLHLSAGTINYGPWADRQRVNLQHVFFPQLYMDSMPAIRRMPGQERIYTLFKIYIEIHESITVRIPTREASKDWKWKLNAGTNAGKNRSDTAEAQAHIRNRKKSIWHRIRKKSTVSPEIRPMGWLDIRLDPDSTVNYNMAMVAAETGYKNTLDIDCRSIEITSSVNHGLLWRSECLQLNCDLSNPCQWNSLRTWTFGFSCNELDLFILRDHAFLFADLINDWASGPAPDFYTFVPFEYILKLNLRTCKIYLNVNDGNIINNPSDMDDNTFLLLQISTLCANVDIPLRKLNALKNKVMFGAVGEGGELHLSAGARSTLKTNMNSTFLGKADHVQFKGCYDFFTESSPSLTDTLTLDIQGTNVLFCLYGFLIHYFIQFKENYFGDCIHFKTMEEYQGLPHDLNTSYMQMTDQEKPPLNDLDVILLVSVAKSSLLLPSNLYTATKCIQLQIPYLNLDLRVTNYYMDMTTEFSPITVMLAEVDLLESFDATKGHTQIFIDCITISGHRLFGLPPTEPTYICLWDFRLGDVTGDCSLAFGERFATFVNTFPVALDDSENVLSLEAITVIADVTFLRLRSGLINVSAHVEEWALQFRSSGLSLDFNDYATRQVSQRLRLCASDNIFVLIESSSSTEHCPETHKADKSKTVAFLRAAVSVDLLNAKENAMIELEAQQHHLRKHDMRTNRCPFLIFDQLDDSAGGLRASTPKTRLPAMTFPPLPFPVRDLSDHILRNSDSISKSFGSLSSLRLSTSSFVHTNMNNKLRRESSMKAMTEQSISLSRPQPFARKYVAEAANREPNHSFTLSAAAGDRKVDDFESIDSEDSPNLCLWLLKPSVFSSPKFPLLATSVEMTDVPSVDSLTENIPIYLDSNVLINGPLSDDAGSSPPRTNLFVDFKHGIQAYGTQKAIMAIPNILLGFTSTQPEDLLDDLQVKVMEAIARTQSIKPLSGPKIDVSLRIAFISARFDLMPDPVVHGMLYPDRDRYEIHSNGIELLLRSKSEAEVTKSKISIGHITFGRITLSLIHYFEEGKRQEPVTVILADNLTAWFSDWRSKEAGLTLRDLQTSIHCRNVGYLCEAFDRLKGIKNLGITSLDGTKDNHQLQMQSLICQLCSVRDGMLDPPFISRPSYTLRAYAEHFRNNFSWKVISRLRYILKNMSEKQKESLRERLLNQDHDWLTTSEDYVLSKLSSWQICDPEESLRDNCFMRKLFGEISDSYSEKSGESHFMLSLKIFSAQVIVDPGHKQSILNLDDSSVYLEIYPSQNQNFAATSRGVNPHRIITIELYIKNIVVGLDWTLFEVLKENSILLKEHIADGLLVSEDPSSIGSVGSNSYQVIVVAERGSMQVDSTHLTHVAESADLAFSYASNPKVDIGVLLHANSLSSSLYSLSQQIWVSSLVSSAISASKTMPSNDEIGANWQVIGSAERAYVDVKEEIHSLIEITDKVILNEVAYVKQLYDKITARKAGNTKSNISSNKMKPRQSYALLLGSYHFQCVPLHSLLYMMRGGSSRVAGTVTAEEQLSANLTYDLSTQIYSIFNQLPDQNSIISNLTLPPIGGQLAILDQGGQRKVTTSTTLEEVTIDARSIYAFLDLINRPEIVSAFMTIREDFDVITSNVKALSRDEKATSKNEGLQDGFTSYDIFCTLSGINVIVEAPSQKEYLPSSSFKLKIQLLQLKATNSGSSQRNISLVPDVLVKMQEVGIYIGELIEGKSEKCGSIKVEILASCENRCTSLNKNTQVLAIQCKNLSMTLFTETASILSSIIDHLQRKIEYLGLSKERKYLRKLRHIQHGKVKTSDGSTDKDTRQLGIPFDFLTGSFVFEIHSIQVNWIVGKLGSPSNCSYLHDLIFSVREVAFRVSQDLKGRLSIEETQLQMVPAAIKENQISTNFARLPRVVLNVALRSLSNQWSINFRATGEPLDIRLLPDFLRPAYILKTSMEKAIDDLRSVSLIQRETADTITPSYNSSFSKGRSVTCTIDADFAGAKVQFDMDNDFSNTQLKHKQRNGRQFRYERFSYDGTVPRAVLSTPGIALKLQYANNLSEPRIFADICINASTNNLNPIFVPIALDILDSINHNIRQEEGKNNNTDVSSAKSLTGSLANSNTFSTIENTKLHLGIRICKQEFSLTCRPVAKVAATATFDEVYLTMTNIYSAEQNECYSLTGKVKRFRAAIQHVYSQESTFNLNVHSMLLSVLRTKSSAQQGGIFAIAEISPIKMQANAKQLHNFLLFRDIWIPDEVRNTEKLSLPSASTNPHEYFIQRYRQIAAATPFSWAVTLTVSDFSAEIDLGQAIGRMSIRISEIWVSSRKSSIWEQTLCAAVGTINAQSIGRMSGEVNLDDINLQTSITWPQNDTEYHQTPLVQGSLRFDKLLIKAAFDYQAFVIADVRSFEFLMFNIRNNKDGDRLFATIHGKQASAFITTLSVSQAVALIQAFERLNEDNRIAYQQSLADVEKIMHRRSSSAPGLQSLASRNEDEKSTKAPISLRTTIVVTLESVSFGAFPSNFYDSQVLLMEHLNAEARFAVAFEEGKVHSVLGMTLGQLRISLGPVNYQKKPDTLDKLEISEVVERATSPRSGTILRVPRVVAQMHSWQVPTSDQIGYTFKSIFEGKVDVGWNYSRISFIRNMWNNHTKALSSRLGRPVRESAVQITGLDSSVHREEGEDSADKQEAIKAVVNVPQSKYTYTAIEAPIIEAPQLRDMGEATPPLEWIGLQRERLPNVTHQIVIVALLEVAKEVEDAYIKILGSS